MVETEDRQHGKRGVSHMRPTIVFFGPRSGWLVSFTVRTRESLKEWVQYGHGEDQS